jgi:hypothetical protein
MKATSDQNAHTGGAEILLAGVRMLDEKQREFEKFC